MLISVATNASKAWPLGTRFHPSYLLSKTVHWFWTNGFACIDVSSHFGQHHFMFKLGCVYRYTAWNILNFEALLRVNLAEYSIFYQINLLFTVVLWTIVFGKRYNILQW